MRAGKGGAPSQLSRLLGQESSSCSVSWGRLTGWNGMERDLPSKGQPLCSPQRELRPLAGPGLPAVTVSTEGWGVQSGCEASHLHFPHEVGWTASPVFISITFYVVACFTSEYKSC